MHPQINRDSDTKREADYSVLSNNLYALLSIFCLVVRPRIHHCTSKLQHLLVRSFSVHTPRCFISVFYQCAITSKHCTSLAPHPYLCHVKQMLGAICCVLQRSVTASLVYQAQVSATLQQRWKTNYNKKIFDLYFDKYKIYSELMLYLVLKSISAYRENVSLVLRSLIHTVENWTSTEF